MAEVAGFGEFRQQPAIDPLGAAAILDIDLVEQCLYRREMRLRADLGGQAVRLPPP